MKMILENKGIKTDSFYVPPFDLYEGEVAVLYLWNGGYYYDTEMFLKDIFCGIAKNKNVIVYKKMTFVERFKESNFRRIFYPTTVGEYLRKNANLDDPFSKKIFEEEWITNKTKVNTLNDNTSRRLLFIYATLSKTKDIVFDMAGVGPEGAKLIFKMVKEVVETGGSAILLDGFDDMKQHASKFVELEWDFDNLPTPTEFKLKLNQKKSTSRSWCFKFEANTD